MEYTQAAWWLNAALLVINTFLVGLLIGTLTTTDNTSGFPHNRARAEPASDHPAARITISVIDSRGKVATKLPETGSTGWFGWRTMSVRFALL